MLPLTSNEKEDMIRQISHYFESKTGVYLHPRFIISVLGLVGALLVFGAAYTMSRAYTDSVKTVGPNTIEAQEKYDARMRAGVRVPSISPE